MQNTELGYTQAQAEKIAKSFCEFKYDAMVQVSKVYEIDVTNGNTVVYIAGDGQRKVFLGYNDRICLNSTKNGAPCLQQTSMPRLTIHRQLYLIWQYFPK